MRGSRDPHQPDWRSMEACQGPLLQDVWNQYFTIWGSSMWNHMKGRGQVQYLWVTFRPLNVIYSLSGSLEYTYPTPIFPTESSRSGLDSTSRLGEWEIKPGKLFFYNFDYEAFTFKLFPNSTFRSIQMPRQIHQKKLKGPLLNFLHLRHSFSITSNKCWTGDATETRDFFGWEPLTWCKCLPPARMKLKQTEPYVPSHPRNLVKFLINNYSPIFQRLF